jgi:hypothetical protein
MRAPTAAVVLLLVGVVSIACDEARVRAPAVVRADRDAAPSDAAAPTDDAAQDSGLGASDAEAVRTDAQSPDAAPLDGGGPGPDASAADATPGTPDAGPSADAALTPDAGPAPTAPSLARGVVLEHVAVFQAVKVDLVVSGAERRPRNAPIVAGRDALLRLYVRPTGGAQVVMGVVTVDGERFTQQLDVRRASVEDDPATVFTLSLPARVVREGVRWSAQLESPAGVVVAPGVADGARWPRTGGTAELRAQSDGGGLRLLLVPVRYDTDGSGRLPDTSPAQLARYRTLLQALYPVANLDVRVRAPVAWTRALYPNGNFNFDRLNDLLVDLRVTDSAADDVYYYALVVPAATFDGYCGGSCVTGQSYVPQDPLDADIRVGGGMGYTGDSSAWTLVHEVGHLHGRSHAPCAVNSWDASYPYLDGDVGVWGYDVRDGTLVPPGVGFTDFMGYCDDTWISDYTYAGIFERTIEQRGGTVIQRRRPWLGYTVTLGPEGAVTSVLRAWSRAPGGPRARVVYLDVLGREVAHGEATRLLRSHELSAQWALPPPPPGAFRGRVGGETFWVP